MTAIDRTDTIPWKDRDWGTRQYGVDLGLNPMTEEIVDMCVQIFVDSPDQGAATVCPGHAPMVWNREVAPKWLIDETAGRGLYQSDGGWPSIARYWDYINWGRLIKDHDGLVIDGFVSEQWERYTSEIIAVCDELRTQGFAARLDVELAVEDVQSGQPMIGLIAHGLIVPDTKAAASIDAKGITHRLLEPSRVALNEVFFQRERGELNWYS
ncbi:hypothetical protein BAURA86_03946 [Brevibacterium aurantiacum]|uniref:Uncharacterized protein n=1 Tax=Brevibacterium aurantiacum TaxID=273384 RepID=A0A2H1KZD8_BREAU|nr:hypothetical protein [Brevibacterium aurantiacum]SMY05097.1 hypothetical protein BAURA86_03946 [Brevibacterium aurantiacum]